MAAKAKNSSRIIFVGRDAGFRADLKADAQQFLLATPRGFVVFWSGRSKAGERKKWFKKLYETARDHLLPVIRKRLLWPLALHVLAPLRRVF